MNSSKMNKMSNNESTLSYDGDGDGINVVLVDKSGSDEVEDAR